MKQWISESVNQWNSVTVKQRNSVTVKQWNSKLVKQWNSDTVKQWNVETSEAGICNSACTTWNFVCKSASLSVPCANTYRFDMGIATPIWLQNCCHQFWGMNLCWCSKLEKCIYGPQNCSCRNYTQTSSKQPQRVITGRLPSCTTPSWVRAYPLLEMSLARRRRARALTSILLPDTLKFWLGPLQR